LLGHVFLDQVHGRLAMMRFVFGKSFQIQLALKISVVASAARTSAKAIKSNSACPLNQIPAQPLRSTGTA
jgi:hypothetical protein